MSDLIPCSRSRQSGRLIFPSVAAGSTAAPLYEDATIPNQATLYSFTTIHPNPKSGQPPFSLGYADFDDKLRVFGKLGLAADQRPEIGMALRMETAVPEADSVLPYVLVPVTAA